MTQLILDVSQSLLAAGLVYACYLRIDALRVGVSRGGAIAAQLSTLAGAALVCLSPLFHWHATWASSGFLVCVMFTTLVGRPRWRYGAPSDTMRQARRQQTWGHP